MIVEVLDLARREFDEAFVYYESQRPGLGEEFRRSVKRQVERIKAHPDAWMPVSSGVRKCLGRQFPYNLVYQQTETGVLIPALAHKKRIPTYWVKRIRKL